MQYNSETCAVELAVEQLCEMTVRGGDLGGYAPSFHTPARLDLGEVRSRLQKEAGGYYRSDVPLSLTMLSGGMYFTVSGMADGVIRDEQGVILDTVFYTKDFGFRLPPSDFLLARMYCYGYALAVSEDLSVLRSRITYFHPDTKRTKYFEYHLPIEVLKEAVSSLLSRVERRARLLVFRQVEGLPSAARAPFPYPVLREGQEIMIREVHGAIRRGKRLFVEAPTGTGKTVSALYPAVRALGEGRIDKIFYLTAKASTSREAFRAAAKLYQTGVSLKTVVIASKEQMCRSAAHFGGVGGADHCSASDCPLARSYYARAGEAVTELLEKANGFPTSVILDMAKKYGVCPYELSLDLSEYCDIVICDYNYAFDPAVYFRRYFGGDALERRYVFLIDEAHNLADRARDMYSAILRRSEFDRVAEMFREEETLSLLLAPAVMSMSRLRELCREDLTKDADGNERGFYMNRAPLTSFNAELELFRKRCGEWMNKHREHPMLPELEKFYTSVKRYLSVNEFFDKGFLCYVALEGGDLMVKTYCLDPSGIMNALLNRASSAILFSATLTPPEYFCDVLGSGKKALSVSLPSPFDPDNLCVAVADYLSLRMEDRRKNYAKYATVIAATVSAMAGNYIAYFPSYDCLAGVYHAFSKKYPNVETVVQKQGMGREQREEFLAAFKNDTGHLRVGFCVMGGAFSEGVDLPGSRLIGSIIFGVGLPSLSNERNMIRDYFDADEGMGYDYAYTYLGMNRVLQAVGRVIRRDTDRGVAILVDDRYASPKYRALFPKHWKTVQYARNAPSLAEVVRRFWKNRDKSE